MSGVRVRMSARRMSSGMAKLAADWEGEAASSAARKGPAVDGSHGGVPLSEGRSDFFERCEAREKSKNQPPAQNGPQTTFKNLLDIKSCAFSKSSTKFIF